MESRTYPFLLNYLTVFLGTMGAVLGGWSNLVTPFLVFVVIPALDAVYPRREQNFPAAQEAALRERKSFLALLYCYPLIHFFCLFMGCFALKVNQADPLGVKLLLTLNVGLATGGIGITAAHELFHKNDRWSRFLAGLILTPIFYTHFLIEHSLGHHVHVATSRDPASARYGESFYRFFPRTFFGGWRSAWKIEQRRLARRGLPAWHWRNHLLRYPVYQAAFTAFFWLFFGGLGLAFLAGQAAVAIVLVELVNYVEHYGLGRAQRPQGGFERVGAEHTWNSSHYFSNLLLFNLQRHGDHHLHSKRPFQILRHSQRGPQLPCGYPLMILLALLPPAWAAVMHPRFPAGASIRS